MWSLIYFGIGMLLLAVCLADRGLRMDLGDSSWRLRGLFVGFVVCAWPAALVIMCTRGRR